MLLPYSLPVVVPEIADKCVVLNGVAKTYAMTGWRVGWMIGPADLVKAAQNLQSHSTSNVANVGAHVAKVRYVLERMFFFLSNGTRTSLLYTFYPK